MADNGSQNEIVFAIKAPGAQESAQQVAAFAASLKQTDQATASMQGNVKAVGSSLKLVVDNTKQASDSLDKISANTKKASDSLGSFAQSSSKGALVIGSFGNAFTKAAPELETFAQSVTRASSTIQNMSFLLGGGAGIAAGGLLLLVSTVAEKLGEARKESAAFAKAQDDAAKSSAEFYKNLKSEQLALRDSANQTAANLGKTSAVIDLENKLAEAQKARAAIGGAAARNVGGAVGSGGIRIVNQSALNLDARIKYLQDELAKARANKHYGETPAKITPKPYDPGFTTDAGVREYAAEQDAADRAQSDIGRTTKFAEGMREGQTRVNEKKSQLDQEFAIQRAHTERMVQDAKTGARSISAEYERVDRETTQRHQEMREMFASNFAAIGAQGVAALQKLAKGQKVTVKDFLSGVGDEMVAEGTRYMFKGGIEVLLGNPGGAAAAALGAAEVAAGIALGAATRGGSAPAGGGGGSGRNTSGASIGSAPTYWNGTEFVRGAPSSPLVGPSGGSGGVIIINNDVKLQSYVTPNGDDAVRVQRAYDEAYRLGKLPRPRAA